METLLPTTQSLSKIERYQRLQATISAVLAEETDPILWMCTIACLLKQEMGFFWAGFYRAKERHLIIGPYQGTLGCLHIPFGHGVCGAAAAQQTSIVVEDVDAFPGHIACDNRSRSEIVIPVFDAKGDLRAVLDVDSDQPATFDQTDREELESVVASMRHLQWTQNL